MTRMIAMVLGITVVGLATARDGWAQSEHQHAMAVAGVPGGIPLFCAEPTASTVQSGAWSNPATWSTGRAPATNDRVKISVGHSVVYDVVSEARIQCIDLQGTLSFKTDADTRLKIVNLTVAETGTLEVGTPSRPIVATATAEIVVADQPFDPTVDPAQVGNGVEGLGRVTMSGAVKTPTFLRLGQEALAGQGTLTFEQPVGSWKAGDKLSVPDTRQLRENERGSYYQSLDEKVEIASIAGAQVTLTAPLKYDHKGAHNVDGSVAFLPHIGNLTRNVVVRSENPSGTRGHMIFMARATVDLRYVEVREMGRTKMGVLDSTEFDDKGQVKHLGTNQIGRYGIHFHHYFGPKDAPADGYQFTVIGTATDGAPKWGITVHNSHYGLVQDNVVFNTKGAGIVTEDGTESFNVFDHNFAMRSEGSGDFAPRSGYSGAGPDPGGEGSGFWFRGPNNYIRNNVAANGDVFGFNLAAGALGKIRIPAFKGADTHLMSETKEIDTTDATVLEFSNNEAYGAIQTGMAFGWNGTIANFRAWNTARHGLTATPTDKLRVEGVTVRGDRAILANEFENPAGIWIANYLSKSVIVRNADVEGMRTGVASPFFAGNQTPEPGRGDGSVLIENSRFKDYVGVVVATAYAANSGGDQPVKTATVRASTFEPLPGVPPLASNPPAAVSMNYRMAPGDTEPREPIFVYDFNRTPGDNFRVYYSLDAPQRVAPCHDKRAGVDGWICK